MHKDGGPIVTCLVAFLSTEVRQRRLPLQSSPWPLKQPRSLPWPGPGCWQSPAQVQPLSLQFKNLPVPTPVSQTAPSLDEVHEAMCYDDVV